MDAAEFSRLFEAERKAEKAAKARLKAEELDARRAEDQRITAEWHKQELFAIKGSAVAMIASLAFGVCVSETVATPAFLFSGMVLFVAVCMYADIQF